jgi:ferrochelatase
MEVAYDLDLDARARAVELGLNLVRAATVGTHPGFVRMIRELVVERIEGKALRPSLGTRGPAPDECAPDCCLVPRPRA